MSVRNFSHFVCRACSASLRTSVVLSAGFRFRPSEVVSSLNGGAELWRWPRLGGFADFGLTDVCFGNRN